MKNFLLITFLTALVAGVTPIQAQSIMPDSTQAPPYNWFLLDPENDHVQGISIEKAYEQLLKGKPARKVIVAVMDTGIDIHHEDLKDNVWTNTNEIPGNGIDDDKNGYADDVHGWNFIGGKAGNVVNDHAEVTREYMRLKPLYENESKVSKKDKEGLAYWKKVQQKYERDSKANQKKLEEYEQQLNLYTGALYTIAYCDSIVKKELSVQAVSLAEVKALPTDNDTLLMVKRTLESVFENVEEGNNLNKFLTELEQHVLALNQYVESLKSAVLSYDLAYKPRDIVGDQVNNATEKFYGNNDVSDAGKHGTHVAGIIAANRDNALGMKGVASHVEIMPVRVVPASGDERDKDVANGIIYAVDNGAKIINMSFGKYFSPDKSVVEKAIRYAEQKGVLLVHAAGNDGDDIDTKDHFPVPDYSNGKQAANWLEVGASSWGAGKNFVADFSNYGKKTVDVFSPGTDIYATTPANTYESLQGTSMATPVVAGVASMLMAYFPELNSTDVKEIIAQSSRKFENLKVNKPGTSTEVEFKELSKSGGLINAYEAVKLASTWKRKDVRK
jgi:subtilisin family serine protease